MADLNLSLEIQGTTRQAVDELGRMKAAVDQVGQSFAKQSGDAQAAGQAGTQAVAQMTDRARAANEVLRQLVERGRSFSDAFKTAQSFGGVPPTLSAADLGLRAQAAQAAQAATPPTRTPPPRTAGSSERGGGGGLLGFIQEDQSFIRFAAGVVGVGLGLNVAAEAARKLHEQIAAAIDAERGLEIGARSVAAAYGAAVLPAFQAASQAFALDPSTRGSAAQFLQTASGMRELTTAYGLNDQQVQQLIQDAGQLARIHGTDLPTASKALQAVMMGNTSAAAALGVTLTDEVGRLRGVGASYEELVAISGRARAEALLFAKTHEAVAAEQKNAAKTSDEMAAALDRLGKAADRSKAALGDLLKGPVSGGTDALADLLNGDPSAMMKIFGTGTGNLAMVSAAEQIKQQRALAIKQADASLPSGFANEQLAGELYRRSAVQPMVSVYERWRIEIQRTTESLQRLQVVQSQFATFAKAAEGVDFPFRLEAGQAGRIGAARAAVDFQNEQAQKEAADKANALRAHLEQNITTAQQIGPDATARARIDLQYYDQRAAAQAKIVEAQHEQVTAEMALSIARRQDLDNVQALANAQAEIVGHAQEQRDIAHELNSIEDQRLQVAREADVLRARQAQLPAGRNVQDLERERQLLLAQAHLHPDQRADVAGRLRDIALHGLPEAQFAELQAQGPLIAAQRRQEDTDIARQIRLTPTRLRQIDLEAVLRVAQDAAARAQERQQLTILGATPEEIAVERARRAAEDAQHALYGIPSPSATATARGVGAQPVQVVVNIDASGRADVSGGNAALQRAGQAAGTAGWNAFNEALATQGTPPVRPMLGAADALLEP